MADHSRVDPAQMAKGKTLVEEATHDVNGYLRTLQGDVDELLVNWKSAGADGFRTAHADWTDKANKISTALENLGGKLGVVGTVTSKGDTAVASAFNKFAN